MMAIPVGATVRFKRVPQRGQVMASAETMAPHAEEDVIPLPWHPTGYRQVNESGVDDWVSAGHVDSP